VLVTVRVLIVPYPAHSDVRVFSLDSLTLSFGSRFRIDWTKEGVKAVARFMVMDDSELWYFAEFEVRYDSYVLDSRCLFMLSFPSPSFSS